MSRALCLVVLLASVAVAQPPVEEDIFAPPPAEVVEIVRPVELPTRRIFVGGDIGATFGGWGVWRGGTISPPQAFARRQALFPLPVAEYAHDIPDDFSIAARVLAGYTFEQAPVSVVGSWETYHRAAKTWLLGYDPVVVPNLRGLNLYGARMRERQRDRSRAAEDPVADLFGNLISPDDEVDDRPFPRFQMRRVPSDPHWLKSRVSANIADVTVAYRVWTPREASGVQYHLLVGGRYGGFFADDRATGSGYEQSASNWFAGFGPHGGLRAEYHFRKREESDPMGFRAWADARGGALYGQITQRFREFDAVNGADSPFRELVVRADRTVPFLATEVGFGLFGPRGGWLTVGVRYSQYWGIGDVGPSRLSFAAVAGYLGVGVGF